jgi:hypothetical protein
MSTGGMIVGGAFDIAELTQFPGQYAGRQYLSCSPSLSILGSVNRPIACKAELARIPTRGFINHIANCLTMVPLRQAIKHHFGNRTFAFFAFTTRLVIHHFG